MNLKTRGKEQNIEHDPNDVDIYRRELLERERDYKQKNNSGSSKPIEDDPFRMPKKREIKGISKKMDELKSRGNLILT